MLLLLVKDTKSFLIFWKIKTIINIKNRDNRCFWYSILYLKHKLNIGYHLERPILYTQKMFKINILVNLQYPITLSDVHLY